MTSLTKGFCSWRSKDGFSFHLAKTHTIASNVISSEVLYPPLLPVGSNLKRLSLQTTWVGNNRTVNERIPVFLPLYLQKIDCGLSVYINRITAGCPNAGCLFIRFIILNVGFFFFLELGISRCIGWGLHSRSLTVRPWKVTGPQQESSLPTTIFQGLC